jgi:hypothetical protein
MLKRGVRISRMPASSPAPSPRCSKPERARMRSEDSMFELIAEPIERLYDREPELTRNLLEHLRMASTADGCAWT